MLVPLPNIETRRRFLKYHDLHHLVTGYSVGRIGEGEVSAWELGTGSAFVSPTLGVMNLIALSTGLVLEPKRMWLAFRRGCMNRNLYPAEDYHQDYVVKNPYQPYIVINDLPKVANLQRQFPHLYVGK